MLVALGLYRLCTYDDTRDGRSLFCALLSVNWLSESTSLVHFSPTRTGNFLQGLTRPSTVEIVYAAQVLLERNLAYNVIRS